MMGLTKQQGVCLRFIETYRAEHKSPPAYREIMAHMGFKSPSRVCDLIDALVERGAIERMPGKARSIRVVRGTGETLPARMAYLTQLNAGEAMLNIQTESGFHRFGINEAQLLGILADGTKFISEGKANA